jgi:hypothetical protein
LETRILEQGANFIWENARLLERVIFEHRFCGGSGARILDVLRTYQNPDGGFGHALEPDLRAPDSQPLFAEFGLRTLYECGLRDAEMAYRACEFLAQHADLERGIPPLLASSRNYPQAAHWSDPKWELPSMDRLTGLVGLVNGQGVRHPWLSKAVEACLKHMTTTQYRDAHTILMAFSLLESLPSQTAKDDLFAKLAVELLQADFFCADVPVTGYGLTPLACAPTPGSVCRKIFSDAQIDAHLDNLASQQQEDGGWPISWEPPGEAARCEWRARGTLSALSTLRAYGRI